MTQADSCFREACFLVDETDRSFDVMESMEARGQGDVVEAAGSISWKGASPEAETAQAG